MVDIGYTERLEVVRAVQELEAEKNTQAEVTSEESIEGRSSAPDLSQRVEAALQNGEAAPLSSVAEPAEEAEELLWSQIGPLHAGPVVFPSGVAVGGWSNLTLHRNGAYNFSGHFHVSGAISYNISFVWAIRDRSPRPTIYVFAHNGRLHGTFEPGSRDSDWNKHEVNQALAAGWPIMEQTGYNWRWTARVNADFTPWLDGIIKAVAAGQAIARVVTIFA